MKLTDLPNIGPVLADNLIRQSVDPGACLHQLQAIAGAVEGIPKKDLPPERKTELKIFFDSHK